MMVRMMGLGFVTLTKPRLAAAFMADDGGRGIPIPAIRAKNQHAGNTVLPAPRLDGCTPTADAKSLTVKLMI